MFIVSHKDSVNDCIDPDKAPKDPNYRDSVTDFKVIFTSPDFSIVKCTPGARKKKQ